MTELVRIVERDKRLEEHENVTAVIQLLDNSVFHVGGPGGTRHLPSDDSCGTCHIDGALRQTGCKGPCEQTNTAPEGSGANDEESVSVASDEVLVEAMLHGPRAPDQLHLAKSGGTCVRPARVYP